MLLLEKLSPLVLMSIQTGGKVICFWRPENNQNFFERTYSSYLFAFLLHLFIHKVRIVHQIICPLLETLND